MLLGSLLVLLNSCCVASPAKDEVSEMSTSQATLFLLRGKIVAGKSTLANGLATRPTTLLISEDHWHSSLFLGIPDHRSLQLIFRAPAQGHGAACCFLAEGGHVGGARFSGKYFNELHFLDVSDETCKRRLREQNSAGGHPFQASDHQLFCPSDTR
jgi:hypothetical protein